MTKITIGINKFMRRQTADSKYSYFSGTDEELIGLTQQNFPLRRKGSFDGTFVVPVPTNALNGEYVFYAAVARIRPHMFFNAECIGRGRGEHPLMCVSAVTTKPPGTYAEVVLWSKELLEIRKQRCTDNDFEIVSLHVSDVDNQPEHPYELARRVLGINGPLTEVSAEVLAQSILYWSEHVFVKKRFTRYIDAKIIELLNVGNPSEAVNRRRTAAPKKTKPALKCT